MMKRIMFLFLLAAVALADSSNLSTVEITPTANNKVGNYFMYNLPGFNPDPFLGIASNGASTISAVITSMTGINYSHLRVNNNTGASLMLVTTNTQIPAPLTPGANTSGSSVWRVLYIANSTNQVWDEVPVFNNLFIAGNPTGVGGGSISSGNIDIMVWGNPTEQH